MKNIIRKILKGYINESDKIKGGLSDKKTIEDIADRHSVSLSQLKQELHRGIKVELEHTNSKNVAKEIAMDHLYEDPKYYTKLKKIHLDENELPIVGAVPSYLTYNVKIKGRQAGTVTINKAVPELGNDTAEIIDVQMIEGYNDLDPTIKAVNHIWTILPEVQRLVVSVTPENQYLWEKLGFQRLNDSFWMKMRGH